MFAPFVIVHLGENVAFQQIIVFAEHTLSEQMADTVHLTQNVMPSREMTKYFPNREREKSKHTGMGELGLLVGSLCISLLAEWKVYCLGRKKEAKTSQKLFII